LLRSDLSRAQFLEHGTAIARIVTAVIFMAMIFSSRRRRGSEIETDSFDDLVEARSNRRVRNAELTFDLANDAAIFEEHFNEIELPAIESKQRGQAEVTLYRDIAGAAGKALDGEVAIAGGALENQGSHCFDLRIINLNINYVKYSIDI
jgi:hypothetical protein